MDEGFDSNLFQRRRQLRGDHHDEGDPTTRRDSHVEAAGHLQVLLRDRRRVFPVRRADLLHEIRILDVRRQYGKYKSNNNNIELN